MPRSELWEEIEADLPFGRWIRATAWRIGASILAPVAWLCLTLLFFAFWAHGLTLAQEIVVGVVSVISLFGTLAAIWVSFGVGVVRGWVHL